MGVCWKLCGRRQIACLCLATVAVAAVAVGCGESDEGAGEAAEVQRQLEEARKEGAREARQRDRIKGLQKRVKNLEGARGASSSGSQEEHDVPASSTAESTVRQTFHTPNVSCEIRTDGALCTVNSTGETFVFEDGGAAYIEPGSRVPEDAGALAAWDSAVSGGSVTCTIPPLDEPRGIACVDAETGHGFEASRVPARQRAY